MAQQLIAFTLQFLLQGHDMDLQLSRQRASSAVPTFLRLILLCLPLGVSAGLSFDETTLLARDQAPSLLAQRSALAGAQALKPAAGTLPDPRLIAGVDNLPISGADKFSLSRDFMTMQRIGVMQEWRCGESGGWIWRSGQGA